ncbi:MAG: hypothetical protein JJE49_03610 [Peptostreptococcaceae bacterium]|nr:hypothetical protein [Peptostreptococcaceae bacterium]
MEQKSNAEKIKEELNSLLEIGNTFHKKWTKGELVNRHQEYQNWYTLARKAIARFLPERLEEFKSYYEIDPNRKQLGYDTFVIQDFLKGIVPAKYSHFDSKGQACTCLANQLAIFASMIVNVDSILFDLDSTIYYDYQENELEAAKNVLKINVRAAGALAGVVIEKHLKHLLSSHALEKEVKVKNPGINELVMPLKEAGVIDVPTFQKITYMASIRNICDHDKQSTPTKEQVLDLLTQTNWLIKTVS